MTKYQKPGWLTQHIFNPLVAGATKLGLSMRGSRVLAVRGRKSGEWHETPVNPLTIDDARYLVAPRGETQWVRNLRAAGGGELRIGRKVEPFRAEELLDAQKVEVLRAYLRHWKMETGIFFGGKSEKSTDEELLGIAPLHPVFLITGEPRAG
ncbi:MAG: nitroreductase family deazaflavin-dependent oxidoreductase [Dehalococcoidia bacterium]